MGKVSGFNQLDPQTKRIKPYAFASKPTDNITCIYEDKQTNIWVGTIEGLYFWNRTAGTFKHFGYDGSAQGLNNIIVNTIAEDAEGNMVIGTNGGLNVYNPRTDVFSSFRNDDADPSSLRDNVIRTIIIEENLSNLNFDIDKLAVTLKMSRRQLYRKLSALTNQTAHDFITNTRLDHAAGLLITGQFTISEIGYKVGFSEPSNFSRTFTKKFGKSPKKYLSDKKVV